jgi:hypothetical protein
VGAMLYWIPAAAAVVYLETLVIVIYARRTRIANRDSLRR